MHAVIKDLQVLTTLGGEYHQYPGYSISQLPQYIRDNHRRFLRDISGIYATSASTLAHIPVSVSSQQATSGDSCTCQDCFRVSDSIQKMSLQKIRKHGWLHPAHRIVSNVFCLKCSTNSSTRTRLLEHIMYKGRKSKYVIEELKWTGTP